MRSFTWYILKLYKVYPIIIFFSKYISVLHKYLKKNIKVIQKQICVRGVKSRTTFPTFLHSSHESNRIFFFKHHFH